MGPAQARNFAATVTSADIFVFMDADMIASPDYVAKLIQPILNNTAKGTFTLCEYVANKGTYLADTWSIAGGCEIGTRVGKNHPLEQPVFRALLKNEFLRVEGYSEEGQGAVGEDILLGKKLGYLAHAAPHAVCYHSNPSDLCDFIASAVWYGKGWAYRKSFLQFMKMVLGLLPPVSLIRRLVNFSWFYLPGLLLYDIALLYGALASLGNQKIAK
jgi:glycosyltransferase involved in cell wall biosynthesis